MRLINVSLLVFCIVIHLVYMHKSTFQDVGHLSNDGDGYGTRWIYFPDGDGYPHYVHLTNVEEETLTNRLSTYSDILFRLYIKGLGAHVMGIAASQTKMRVNRITGLDPARPFFEFPSHLNDSEKLDSSDADFVDIIHTCGGLLGFLSPIGTADFYPNNGVAPQPGCEDIVKFFDGCSHGRSFYYFMESVKYPKSFPTYQCESWNDFLTKQCDHRGYMGEEVNRTLKGKYYLITNSFEPFGKGV
ncbi:lipase member H-like [Spodoptera litura]|uniref:Lipase member H-like n=1 Tax=Spodoptera litura TaxID=69820 RepID=A0A9J7DQP4_SPOLT|nr:lipase member H-like [Spodoptera litura]